MARRVQGDSMRTLVVAGEYPWPVNSGSRLRLASILRGLVRCGPVDLFSALPDARSDIDVPDLTVGLDRVAHVAYDDRPPTGVGLARTALVPWTPFEVPRPDGGRVITQLTEFARGSYDLVWYFGMRPWLLAGGLEAAPGILDLVDLEDEKITARMAVASSARHAPVERMRGLASRAFSAEEVRRWRRLQRRASAAAAATVVCSELDAERARATGLSCVNVVPNGYRHVAHPVGRSQAGRPPTVLFQGTLRYPPNAEAARFLVDEVVPHLRQLVPDAEVRLVGTTAPGLERLGDAPGVTLVGQVPDIDDELARADLVVVPIRFGSGTRLKVLEAFAQKIPVVSTGLGAEGLDAEDGVHLLVAEEPEDLARCCAQLLADGELRVRLADQAHQLFLERFTDGVVEDMVEALARATAR